MTLSARRASLLTSKRWRSLAAFVTRWYARPVSDGDGNTQAEIDRAAKRIGAPLPAVLAEWYSLVGRRLRLVQDDPVALDDLAIENDEWTVWRENQGVWTIRARADDTAGRGDPATRVDGHDEAWSDVPLSKALFGMLVSDTLVGAWAGRHLGTAGELKPSVRGGSIDDFSADDVRRIRAEYGELELIRNPFFVEPYRGTAATIIRLQDGAIEWMTSTRAAYAALDEILDFTPDGGEHEVVLAFATLTTAQLRGIMKSRVPDIDQFNALLGDAGRVGMATGGSSPRLHVRTCTPERVRERVVEKLAPDLLARLTIAARPVAVSVFEVLYPPNTRSYVLPD